LKLAAASTVSPAFADTSAGPDPITVGSVLDTSGIFQLYGRPMDKAVTLAVEEINATGGLLDRPLRKIAYDTRSDMAMYSEHATRLAAIDKVDVVHGAVLSAAREVIRPILREAQTLYFYNTQYEGGVCDRNTFCTGVTPAQQTEVLVPEAIERWGKKIYILAADYNYGQITARRIEKYAMQHGGEVVAAEFFALDVSDFSEAIANIQDAKPDIVMSVLVGGAHLTFYRQWSATGMNRRIPLASTTMGAGNEHTALTREEGDGIMMATYQGVHLWAQGVRAAGSVERDKVIEALEGEVSFRGPVGRVSLDAKTHHVVTPVHLIEVNDQKMKVTKSFGERQPVDTQAVCDLVANPADTTQYEI